MRLIFFLAAILFSFNITGQTFSAEKILGIVKTLSSDSLEGREIGSRGSEKAQRLIIEKYKELNLISFNSYPDFKQSFGFKNVSGRNLLGYLKGSKYPEKFIAVTAHYDHEGIKNGKIYNGADDNASGIGGLLALMEYYSNNPSDHSILFIAFDGEERELKGSGYFVRNLPVSANDILLNINMDMISRNKEHQLFVSGTYHYPFLKKFIAPSSSITVKLGHDNPDHKSEDWTFSSDHASFFAIKIPFLYFGVEDHEDYHKPTDDFDRIDTEFYLHCIQYIIDTSRKIDKGLHL
jgi:Zn-dependent M28 family amino/carboxypeptidase